MLVENRYGALLKIAGVFTARAYSISGLNVVQGEEMRQITVEVRCDESQFGLLQKQLLRIADVVEVIPAIQDECPLTHVAAREEPRTA
jgi:acetolactate synthase-1/3 small subunit